MDQAVRGAAGFGPANERVSIGAWLEGRGLGRGPLIGTVPISGGTQNIMLRVERDGRPYVIRRGPQHLRPETNTHLRREARILTALAGTHVPHASLVAFCDDELVWSGSCFYLMECVHGFNATVELPDVYSENPEMRREMGLALVRSLAALGEVDPAAIGLADVGRPHGFLERQVPRWLAQYAGYSKVAGYPDRPHPAVAPMARWLEANRPGEARAGLMHGDFHLANAMFRPDRPEVAAIIDWEMATVADPLLDLGWLIAMWPDNHEGTSGGVVGRVGGLPAEAELITAYAAASTRSLEHIHWYTVLACFKLGILLEGTYARACAGLAPADTGRRLHETSLRLFEQGVRRIRAE